MLSNLEAIREREIRAQRSSTIHGALLLLAAATVIAAIVSAYG